MDESPVVAEALQQIQSSVRTLDYKVTRLQEQVAGLYSKVPERTVQVALYELIIPGSLAACAFYLAHKAVTNLFGPDVPWFVWLALFIAWQIAMFWWCMRQQRSRRMQDEEQ